MPTAKPEKKRKNLPLEENEPWGGGGGGFDDDQRGVSRLLDKRRQVCSSCGGGSFLTEGSWEAGKCQPSLKKSSTIGSGYRHPEFVEEQAAAGDKPEEPQIVNTFPSPEQPIKLYQTSTIKAAAKIDHCHLAPDEEEAAITDIDPRDLEDSLAQTAVGTQVCEMITKEDEEEAAIPPLSPLQLLSKLLSDIDLRNLEDSLAQISEGCPNPIMQWLLLQRFLECLGSHLSEVTFRWDDVTFRWDDIFKEPVSSKLFHDVSHNIPEAFYNITAKWMKNNLVTCTLCDFLQWMFSYIIESVWNQCCQEGKRESPISYSNVAILVAAAIILRSQPGVLTKTARVLSKNQLWYERN